MNTIKTIKTLGLVIGRICCGIWRRISEPLLVCLLILGVLISGIVVIAFYAALFIGCVFGVVCLFYYLHPFLATLILMCILNLVANYKSLLNMICNAKSCVIRFCGKFVGVFVKLKRIWLEESLRVRNVCRGCEFLRGVDGKNNCSYCDIISNPDNDGCKEWSKDLNAEEYKKDCAKGMGE